MAYFEVGKRAIAIKSHSKGLYKKGQVFEVLAIRKSGCKCPVDEIDIGFASTSNKLGCNLCKAVYVNNTGINWVHCDSFKPIDDSLSELTDADILFAEELTEQHK